MLVEPVLVARQIGAPRRGARAVSLAFLAGAAMDADLPTTRAARSASRAAATSPLRTWCATPAPGTITVDAARREVRLDGEPVRARPVERLAFSGSYLIG